MCHLRSQAGTEKKAWDPIGLCSQEPGALTVGAQQALKLGEQPDGVELPQEAVVVQAVPQLDDEATDESGQLWGTDTSLPHSSHPGPEHLCFPCPNWASAVVPLPRVLALCTITVHSAKSMTGNYETCVTQVSSSLSAG